jgi:hypothetical protein
MGLLDNLGDLVKRAAGGNAPDSDVHAAYDQVARTAPQGALADGLAHAFNSDKTPPFEQMLSGLFGQSSADQKAGVLNKVLASLGPSGATQALGAGGLGALAGAVAGGSVTPEQAQQIPPNAVEVLAKQAAQKDPSIVDAAASFYAQHPTLIKSIGAGALALLMSKISQSRR